MVDSDVKNNTGDVAQREDERRDGSERKRLLFILNPKAGTMQAVRYLADILQIFSDAGFLTSVLMTAKSGDAKTFANLYAGDMDRIVCSGGDGTLNEVIEGVLSAGCTTEIGYIPSGSTNDFGASVGLPKGITDAAWVAANGTPKKLDVGSFNGRYFSYVASFGAFTSTSYSVPQNLKNIMGHTAYMLQGIRDVLNIKPVMAKFIVDEGTPNEREFSGDFIFGAICNSTSVGGLLKLDNFDVDMNDGMMELLLIRRPNNLMELNSIALSLLDGQLKADEITFYSVRNIKIRIEPGTPWTLDGEYEQGATDIQVDTLRSAVNLITGEGVGR